MIVEHAPSLWTVEHAFHVMGIPLTTRMTLARIREDQWAAISPVPLTETALQKINACANVSYIIAPNNFHHLFIHKAQSYWPAAELFVPRALIKKRPDLSAATLIDPEQNHPWAEGLSPLRIKGSTFIEEYAFWHEESSTVVLTDICFNIIDPQGFRLNLFTQLTGTKGGLKTSRMMKLFYRDRSALKSSIESLIQRPFTRLVVAHGDIIEQDAPEKLESSFAWLLKS